LTWKDDDNFQGYHLLCTKGKNWNVYLNENNLGIL